MGHSRALFRQLDNLDRDNAANGWILGAVNDTHSATAQFALNFIPASFGGCDHLPIPKYLAQNGLLCTFALFFAEVNAPLSALFRTRHGKSRGRVRVWSQVLRGRRKYGGEVVERGPLTECTYRSP